MAAKKNLKNKLDQHNKEIKSSSELNDRLAADIPETGQEAQEGLYTDSVEAADTLESTGDTTQWQRQNSAESETDAAVEDDMVAHPEAADTDRPTIQSPDSKQTLKEAEEGLGSAQAAASDILESTGDTTQWQRQNSAESVTDEAVEVTMDEETLKRRAVEQAKSIPETDRLHSDIPETRREAEEAVRVDNVEADIDIEATGDVTEWQDAGAEEAETDAAVEVTETKPKRHVKDDLPDYLL
jgi:hypothetical protein